MYDFKRYPISSFILMDYYDDSEFLMNLKQKEKYIMNNFKHYVINAVIYSYVLLMSLYLFTFTLNDYFLNKDFDMSLLYIFISVIFSLYLGYIHNKKFSKNLNRFKKIIESRKKSLIERIEKKLNISNDNLQLLKNGKHKIKENNSEEINMLIKDREKLEKYLTMTYMEYIERIEQNKKREQKKQEENKLLKLNDINNKISKIDFINKKKEIKNKSSVEPIFIKEKQKSKVIIE